MLSPIGRNTYRGFFVRWRIVPTSDNYHKGKVNPRHDFARIVKVTKLNAQQYEKAISIIHRYLCLRDGHNRRLRLLGIWRLVARGHRSPHSRIHGVAYSSKLLEEPERLNDDGIV